MKKLPTCFPAEPAAPSAAIGFPPSIAALIYRSVLIGILNCRWTFIGRRNIEIYNSSCTTGVHILMVSHNNVVTCGWYGIRLISILRPRTVAGR